MKSLVTFLLSLSLSLSSRRIYCYTTLPPGGGPCLPGMRRTG
ncbi:hypothetical protein CCUS01_12009 [Colletotrichum cuscutae]|uniref:Uncharacterized protein n=1 Tax=Colletotrichum cuscutae TaxID=1209917 RepID=A0AAI9TY29_9PEZI|nr:hypothetical protein CCUS01_12009 [Colletotrichum cuscutae]